MHFLLKNSFIKKSMSYWVDDRKWLATQKENNEQVFAGFTQEMMVKKMEPRIKNMRGD